MKLTNTQIKNIIKSQFNEILIKITDKSEGYDHIVKIITTDNNKYVLKSPKRENLLIKNQVFASKSWLKAGVPVPRILYHSEEVIIESFVEGTQLDKLKITEKGKEKIYFQLGKIMKKMHSVKTKGYGPFEGGKGGRYKTPKEYEKWIEKKLSESLKLIKDKKLLSLKEQKILKKYLRENTKFPSRIKFSLCHSDLCEEHIYIKDGKINSIIDLADIKSDDPMSDFRRISKFNDRYLKQVIKGYGKVNKNRIKFHRTLLILYQLPKIYRLKKYKDFNLRKELK